VTVSPGNSGHVQRRGISTSVYLHFLAGYHRPSLGHGGLSMRHQHNALMHRTRVAQALYHRAVYVIVQMGRTAVDAEDYDAALYWFELVRTWAPTSLQAEVDACKAVGAAPGLTVRPGPNGPSLTLLHVPRIPDICTLCITQCICMQSSFAESLGLRLHSN